MKKLVAKVGGSISFIGGITELDVPTFLRNSYEMGESELYERLETPEKFKTIEIFVTPNEIEQRFLWFEKEGKDYII